MQTGVRFTQLRQRTAAVGILVETGLLYTCGKTASVSLLAICCKKRKQNTLHTFKQ